MDDHGPDQDRGSDAVTIAVIVAGLLFMIYEALTSLYRLLVCQRALKLQFIILPIFFLRSQYCASQVAIS